MIAPVTADKVDSEIKYDIIHDRMGNMNIRVRLMNGLKNVTTAQALDYYTPPKTAKYRSTPVPKSCTCCGFSSVVHAICISSKSRPVRFEQACRA